ncbi:hypothetical protein EV702DRAFT_1193559 [Suillus placidus]|uniref:Uncharacterized protein n=1 Tax=Suillus placidus TaxID=48579 RepID=A0A9P7D5T9_9AGAM|nr:hypothetical protein EV702DRAFT_1193559 [Suillus placidus]
MLFVILDTTPHRSGSHFPSSIVYLRGGHTVSSNFVLLAAINCLDFVVPQPALSFTIFIESFKTPVALYNSYYLPLWVLLETAVDLHRLAQDSCRPLQFLSNLSRHSHYLPSW